MELDLPLGGLFFGKCLSETPNEPIEADIFKRLKGLRINRDALRSAIADLPIVSARRLHQAAEFLFILLYETTQLDPFVIQWRRQRHIQQSVIGEYIQHNKKLDSDIPYPYESERALIAKVKIGDRIGAKEILNNLLGAIMFRNPGDLNVLKARLAELLSILSRAAAEGGVDINILLEKNLDYLTKVMSIDNQADLCAWISSALNDFIERVYEQQDSKKVTQIKPAVDFIEANYDQQLTLAMVAKTACLSVSRMAHLFKEQMDITIIDYLTNVRINHAKRLLLSSEKSCTTICFEVGYNNQSYFTRTFKELVGITPKQYRMQNIRTE
jgi:two-component system response regulator YesN